MRTKEMTKEQALQEIEYLNKIISFNNKLNARCRKLMKAHECGYGKKNNFNGFWDEPLDWMKEEFKDILLNNSLEDISWMRKDDKKKYASDCGHIFGGVYSCAVNTYILKDLHDCEKYVSTSDNAEETPSEENEMFTVERNVDTNRINIYFEGIPSEEIRSVVKHNGFRWSPNYKCWTRQLTQEAEYSLTKIKRELGLIG